MIKRDKRYALDAYGRARLRAAGSLWQSAKGGIAVEDDGDVLEGVFLGQGRFFFFF